MAILVWATLAISSYLSHVAMLGFQRASKQYYDLSKPYQCGHFYSLVGILAVVTRLIGKSLAVVNALWIITSVLLQYYGFFDTVSAIALLDAHDTYSDVVLVSDKHAEPESQRLYHVTYTNV